MNNQKLSLLVTSALFAGALLGLGGLPGCDARAHMPAPPVARLQGATAPTTTAGPQVDLEAQRFFAMPYEAFIAQCEAEERAARAAR